MSTVRWKPPSLYQPDKGYRFSVDAWLLASFAAQARPSFFADLGTGCGVIAWSLLQHCPASAAVAIERDPELVDFARRNLAGQAATVVAADVRFFPWRSACVDVLVTNPPYYELGRGIISRDQAKAKARHCLFGNVLDFAQSCAVCLREGSQFCFIYPAPLFEELRLRFQRLGWWPLRILRICSFQGQAPKLVCCALVRQRVAVLEQGLVLFAEPQIYTTQAHSFLEQPHFA